MKSQTRRARAFMLVGGLIAAAAVAAAAVTAVVGRQPDNSILLPNGQTITPAGTTIHVNDRPLAVAITPDGTQAAVATASNFASRALHFIDLATQSVAQTIAIGNSFVGLAFTSDGNTLYVGGGADNDVKIFKRANGSWAAAGTIAIASSAPQGLSISPGGDKVYVALNRGHKLGVIDTASKAVVQIATGAFPYSTAISTDGRKVYVSNWGGRLPQVGDATDGSNPVVVDPATGIANNGTISVFDTVANRVVKDIEVGLHPSGMAVSPDGSRLYVANANSDSVSVIDTARDTVESTIDVRLTDSSPLGSAPNAIAVSQDGETLYVANAGNNAIAVVEPQRHGRSDKVRGFIPVGWFPTAVALTKTEDRLIVGNGYGFGSIAPAPAGAAGRRYQYRTGELSFIPVPENNGQLNKYSKQVMANNETIGGGESPARIEPVGMFPVSSRKDQESPIKHVIYIIKENRTYDQVFGDLPQGNSDPSLTLFGRAVTPNLHALAEQFVVLDNYYTAGDQSGLGHQWCDEAYANDYAHKYGNARNDFAGTNPMAFASSGFIWDNARAHGKSARIFGEFTNRTVVQPANATWTDFYTAWKNGTPGPTIVGASSVKSAQPITSPIFPGYDLRITEQLRADLFLQEFREFERNQNLPALIVMLLPIDHTQGTTPGFPTPRAMVADNDRAVGRIVDAVSHSSDWPTTAIFVTEDDSQDGADHVDGHRSEALIVSPYTRRGSVDSTLYSTVNLVRTIEAVLGLPPMNQFDRAALPMALSFTNERNTAPFDALPNTIPLDEMNAPVASLRGLERKLALASIAMDFSEPDNAPGDLLNRVIWHSVKGYSTPYPSIARAACAPVLKNAGTAIE
ncbi:MAG TPA: bifunctional YncE family protein/alkaline phosphatase family protein [Vicinamibacterales bacterium]|nr:bifunctional YncE family protein/alkaline phosphatase family protein [Vicinamibacterales bacterium]